MLPECGVMLGLHLGHSRQQPWAARGPWAPLARGQAGAFFPILCAVKAGDRGYTQCLIQPQPFLDRDVGEALAESTQSVSRESECEPSV